MRVLAYAGVRAIKAILGVWPKRGKHPDFANETETTAEVSPYHSPAGFEVHASANSATPAIPIGHSGPSWRRAPPA